MTEESRSESAVAVSTPLPVPGYDAVEGGAVAQMLHGVRRWQAYGDGDTVPVVLTWVSTDATPGGHVEAAAMADAVSRLEHPHLINVRAVVAQPQDAVADGALVLVSEAGDGQTLTEVLDRRVRLPFAQALTVLCPIAEALSYVHEQGVVHGALRPDSVTFTPRGMPLLGDTSIWLMTGNGPAGDWVRQGYVAPEVIEGFEVTAEADAYAFAAVAWRVVMGTCPGWPVSGEARDEESLRLPDSIIESLDAGMHSDPASRPSIGEWVDVLQDAGPAEPVDLSAADSVDVAQRLRAWARPQVATSAPAHRSGRAPRVGTRGSGITRTVGALTCFVAIIGVVVAILLALRPWEAFANEPVGGKAISTTWAKSDTATNNIDGPGPGVGSQVNRTVQALLDARAKAWMSGDDTELARVHTPGSAALSSDRREIAAAGQQNLRFEHVAFTAIDVTVLAFETSNPKNSDEPGAAAGTNDEMIVRALIHTDPVVYQDPTGATHRVPAAEETVVVSLARPRGQWLISGWE